MRVQAKSQEINVANEFLKPLPYPSFGAMTIVKVFVCVGGGGGCVPGIFEKGAWVACTRASWDGAPACNS